MRSGKMGRIPRPQDESASPASVEPAEFAVCPATWKSGQHLRPRRSAGARTEAAQPLCQEFEESRSALRSQYRIVVTMRIVRHRHRDAAMLAQIKKALDLGVDVKLIPPPVAD